MSRTLWSRFSNIFTKLLPDKKNNTLFEINVLATCVLTGGNFCYAIGTREEKEIVVSKNISLLKMESLNL
jgi:hypothetical protein